MSLPLAITLIVLLDATLIGLLAFVMSRASRLSPHASPAETVASPIPAVAPGQPQHISRRRAGRSPARTLAARS